MSEYKDYEIIIHPNGPIGTPWQSDTLFGHLAWLVAMQEGESAVKEYLRPFREGAPPFILSDGFPGDALPMPLLGDGFDSAHPLDMAEYAARKERKKAQYLTPESFQHARREGKVSTGFISDVWEHAETLHASLNRNTHSTGSAGQLFSTVETFLKDSGTITVYARCRAGWSERLRALMERLSLTGYGRDKSTGTGAFRVDSMDGFDGFAPFAEANGFISLSTYVPAAHDPRTGKWRLRVKRGFLGDHAGSGNPFKRPLLQFAPGATFHTGEPPRPWYGCTVTGIAPSMPTAIQNCQTIAVPCRIHAE